MRLTRLTRTAGGQRVGATTADVTNNIYIYIHQQYSSLERVLLLNLPCMARNLNLQGGTHRPSLIALTCTVRSV